jgi:hypothetical protein
MPRCLLSHREFKALSHTEFTEGTEGDIEKEAKNEFFF